MKTSPARRRLLIVLLLLMFVWSPAARAAPAHTGVSVEDFTLNFGDFTSKAELSYPSDARGGSPTVILNHGGCTCDMDETFIRPDGGVQSHIFKDIADHLTAHGFAVLRYNKH